MEQNSSPCNKARDELLKEYEMTQKMAVHYDQMNWQIGSILMAGIFIGIGIIGKDLNTYPILFRNIVLSSKYLEGILS